MTKGALSIFMWRTPPVHDGGKMLAERLRLRVSFDTALASGFVLQETVITFRKKSRFIDKEQE